MDFLEKLYKGYLVIKKLARMVKEILKNKSCRGIYMSRYLCVFQDLNSHKMMALTQE